MPEEYHRRLADITALAKDDKAFSKRRTSPEVMLMLMSAVVIFLGMMTVIQVLDKMSEEALIAVFSSGFLLFAALTIAYYEWVHNERFASDFENALFAGAAGAGVAFFFIVKNSREVVYYNPKCRRYFTYQPILEGQDEFDKLMKSIGLGHISWQQDMKIIAANSPLTFSMSDMFGKHYTMQLHIIPISRPDGYYVFKAMPSDKRKLTETYADVIPPYMVELFDLIPMPVYSLKQTGELHYINPAFSSMMGYSPYDVSTQKLQLDALIIQEEDKEAADISQLWEGIRHFRTANGGSVTARIHQVLLPDNEGKELFRCGFLSSSGDGAASSDLPPGAEISSDKNPALLQATMAHSPIAMAFLRQNGHVIHYNKAFSNLVNQQADKKEWKLDIIVSDDQKSAIATAMQSLEKDRQAAPVALNLHSGGASGEVSVTLYLQRLKEHPEAYAIAYLVDNTEFKHLEQQFVQSQKMQAVGQLAGGIAHDFNNLLTAMIGFCDLLLTRHGPGEQSFADIMQIKQNANRAANLVRQLLAFSRKQTLQPKVLDITEVLAELSNLIRRLIGERIQLEVKHGRDLWLVKVDHGQLEQVIINLCVNARDAMPDGGSLTIHTSNIHVNDATPLPTHLSLSPNFSTMPQGEFVQLEVRDTGKGMSRTVMDKIFEPFFTTKGLGEGTGLGLATVCGIVEQTGGFIFVDSAENEGTCFTILLPRHQESRKTNEIKDNNDDAPKDLTGSGTILLVEDEDAVRMFTSRALSNKGYAVLEAASGEDGLKVLEESSTQPRVIVTDVMMPGMTGPEMVEIIRQTHPETKVIFISGYAEDVFKENYGDARDFYFLPKPFTLDQLAAKVKEVTES